MHNTAKSYKPSSGAREAVRAVVLGSKVRDSCKVTKANFTNSSVAVRESLMRNFQELKGRGVGVTVGFIYSDFSIQLRIFFVEGSRGDFPVCIALGRLCCDQVVSVTIKVSRRAVLFRGMFTISPRRSLRGATYRLN